MIYYILTIVVVTLIFLWLHHARLTKLCPICAGVSITWVIGLIGLFTNAAWANPLIISILMGATLGALADKYGTRFGLVWKSGVVLLGLPAIYLFVQKNWLWGSIPLVILGLMTVMVFKTKSPKTENEKDLFKNCC